MDVRRYAVVLTLLVLALGACSSSGSKGSDDRARAAVTIKLFQFSPNPLRIGAGEKVTWTNTDDIAHTITSGAPESPTGVFDSGNFAKGGTFSFTFDQPGTSAYFCRNHNTMRGQIHVT